jgi:hypothetical protein
MHLACSFWDRVVNNESEEKNGVGTFSGTEA